MKTKTVLKEKTKTFFNKNKGSLTRKQKNKLADIFLKEEAASIYGSVDKVFECNFLFEEDTVTMQVKRPLIINGLYIISDSCKVVEYNIEKNGSHTKKETRVPVENIYELLEEKTAVK